MTLGTIAMGGDYLRDNLPRIDYRTMALTQSDLEDLSLEELEEKINAEHGLVQMKMEGLFVSALLKEDFPPRKKVDILQVLMKRNAFIDTSAETALMKFVEDSNPTIQEIVHVAEAAL